MGQCQYFRPRQKWVLHNSESVPRSTELFVFKWLILCYVNFTSIFKNRKRSIFDVFLLSERTHTGGGLGVRVMFGVPGQGSCRAATDLQVPSEPCRAAGPSPSVVNPPSSEHFLHAQLPPCRPRPTTSLCCYTNFVFSHFEKNERSHPQEGRVGEAKGQRTELVSL